MVPIALTWKSGVPDAAEMSFTISSNRSYRVKNRRSK